MFSIRVSSEILYFYLPDASTAKNLELIQNARDPKSGHCLYGVLNHTKTAGGGNMKHVVVFFVLERELTLN